MYYKSTRGGVSNIDFNDIVFRNYASDGGLFVPQYIPFLSVETLSSWSKLSYKDLCIQILSLYVNDDIRKALPQICSKAYSSAHFDTDPIIPITKIDKLYILELFHGKTLAFKDFSLNLVAQIMQYLLIKSNTKQNANIIVHTHGDTGPAAASSIALLGKESRCKLFILYPIHQCSQIQHNQMATLMHKHPNNIRIYATDKNMDEQRVIVKKILSDKSFVNKYKICGMNSINFVRILGQLCYYIYVYLQLEPDCNGMIDIAIPSGAFGNTLACCIAKKMGVGIRNIIPCTNEYDIVYRLFMNGDFSVYKGEEIETLSPAMDTIIPYNIERYIWMAYNGNCQFVKNVMEQFDRTGSYRFGVNDGKLKSLVTYSYRVSNDIIKNMMVRFVTKYKYLPCPHSMTSVYGGIEYENIDRDINDDDVSMVAVATAHPVKFPKIIQNILENEIEDDLQEYIYNKYMHHDFIPNDDDEKRFVTLKHCDEWKSKWINTIKNDIIEMNRLKSKL